MVQYLGITFLGIMKYMAYTTNPKIEEVRYKAYCLIHYHKWSTRKVARHLGYSQSAIVKWSKRHPEYGKYGRLVIPTRSSRPHSHPKTIPDKIVYRVLELRKERNQCAEILHYRLKKEGINISLSSIKRILKRHGISKFSRWKKWHKYPPRPSVKAPGELLEIDSMQKGRPKEHLYVYAMIDLYSRFAFVQPVFRITSKESVRFIQKARKQSPFSFQVIQSDHGPEFSKWFTKVIEHKGIKHRHSRVRKPTDNGYIERFIRTLQQECLSRIYPSLKVWQKEIPEYLYYYNNERPHMALDYRTPKEAITRY